MWAVNPAMITDFLDQHSSTRLSEFWTGTFWMIRWVRQNALQSGVIAWLCVWCPELPMRLCSKTLLWLVIFSHWCRCHQTDCRWPTPNRLRSPFRLQPQHLFAGPEDALWCPACKTPFQRALIPDCWVCLWCAQWFTAILPPLKPWLLHRTAKYTLFCIRGTVMVMQSLKSLTEATHYLPAAEAEKLVLHSLSVHYCPRLWHSVACLARPARHVWFQVWRFLIRNVSVNLRAQNLHKGVKAQMRQRLFPFMRQRESATEP